MLRKMMALIARPGMTLLLGVLVAGAASGLFAFASVPHAHAASADDSNIHISNDCSQPETANSVTIATDGGWDVDCFWPSVSGTTAFAFVNLYNVTSLQTGPYDLYFTWTDCNGGTHESDKGAYTFLAAGNAASDAFGGCDSIADITFLEITSPTSSADCGGLTVATQVAGHPPYVDCLTYVLGDSSIHTVNLYGVYAIWTGEDEGIFGPTGVTYTWTDCHNISHTSTKSLSTFIAAGDAASNGFGGCDRIMDLTSYTIN